MPSNSKRFIKTFFLLLFLLFPTKIFAEELPTDKPQDENTEIVLSDEEAEQEDLEEDQSIELDISNITEPEIYINEIYPAPETSEDEVEWIEIYVEDPSNFDVNQYMIRNGKASSKSLSTAVWNENYLILETGTRYLVNDGDNVSIIRIADAEIIDSICYGDDTTCNLQLTKPANGFSISYFTDIEDFRITSTTPGTENIFINLDFSLQDENDEVNNSFEKGEIISIVDESEYYGIENPAKTWLLDNIAIDQAEILTEELVTGSHTLKLVVEGEEKIIIFTVNENFEGLEISEIFPNPKGDDSIENGEWIEIYNSSNRTINLKDLIIERFTDSQSYKYEIEEDTNILPNEYLVFYPSFSLTNESGNLRLVDPQNQILNTLSYNERIEEDESVIFIDDEVKITITPTKGLVNKFMPRVFDEPDDPVPVTDTDNPATAGQAATNFSTVEISEIYPNPKGDDISGENEWIELYNTGSEKVNLKGLVILQITGRNSRFVIENDLFINVVSYVLIKPSFAINNTEAKFQLLNEEDEVFDEISYHGKVEENESMIRQDDSNELILTMAPTPESANIQSGSVLSAEDVTAVPIVNAKEQTENSAVLVKGAITVEPGILGSDIFYIQDETGGIQVDLNGSNENFLQKDVVIEVEGEIDIYHGERRIKVGENTITPVNQAENVQPEFIVIKNITESDIGSLIKIEGTVVKTSGSTFYINDGSGTIKVQIKSTTDIERPECRKGYYAEITGILSVWDSDENGNPVYRLLPRYQDDIFISKTLAHTGGMNWFGLIIGFCIIAQMIVIHKRSNAHTSKTT